MKLRQLLQAIAIQTPAPFAERDVAAVVCDSRQVRPGAVFVAVRGHSHDGMAFVEDAVARGATAVIADRDVKVRGQAAVLKVPDPRTAFAGLSAMFYGCPSEKLMVCGITGTNGKTTVAFMLRDMLRKTGWNPGMIGTIHYEIGSRVIPAVRTTPDAGEQQALMAQMLQTGCRSVVMEVSSHAIDQKRVWTVDFDVGVFTNLTRDHLDYHGTMEAYYAAKRSFFTRLGWNNRPASAILNIDDPSGRRLSADKSIGVPVVTCGTSPDAMVRAAEISLRANGSLVKLQSPWGQHNIRLRLMGYYNAVNALTAFAAGGALGLDAAAMAAALEALTAVPGRLEEIRSRTDFRVFVDYAHTDDALDNVLKTLRSMTDKRLIVVFGCGGNRDRSKRCSMGAAAARAADLAVVTTDNPRKEDPEAIIRDVVAGFPDDRPPPIVVVDRRAAISRAFEHASAGDIVLIAGKGHESFQEFAHTVIPFDDRVEARELLGANQYGKHAVGTSEP